MTTMLFGPPTPLTDDVVVQREMLATCLDEARPLLEAHWREIAHYQDIPLNPQWDTYDRLEQIDVLRIFTLRENEALKGYAVFIVKPNMHYQSSLQAVQDILYLAPESRQHVIGIRFLQWCDGQLAREGVQAVFHHVKRQHDFGPVLQWMGYEAIETVWGRRLDRGGR